MICNMDTGMLAIMTAKYCRQAMPNTLQTAARISPVP